VNRSVHATATRQLTIRRIDDGVDVERRDVANNDVDHG
jgi:hypothetical protein